LAASHSLARLRDRLSLLEIDRPEWRSHLLLRSATWSEPSSAETAKASFGFALFTISFELIALEPALDLLMRRTTSATSPVLAQDDYKFTLLAIPPCFLSASH
jgi:hypothetical protein